MTTAAPPKPRDRRTTWLDILSEEDRQRVDDALITRQELLTQLAGDGVEVPETTLVGWEKKGIVPRPLRRHRGGAPRALYPPHAARVLTRLRQYQEQGLSLEALTPLVWQDARYRLLAYAPSLTETRKAGRYGPSWQLGVMREAAFFEHHANLSPGTVASVELDFQDAAGKTVFRKRQQWSPEWAEAMRNTFGWDLDP